MNILIVCNWGKNRSGYLSSYLQEKGYNTKFGGVCNESENPITQTMVDWSNIIIFVQIETKKKFLENFKVNKHRIITLNVEDRIEVLASRNKEASKMEWIEIQKKFVYPELEKQIKKHLPFK